MKFLLALTLAGFTTAAFAVDFTAKLDNIDCKISNGTVTRTLTLMKDTDATMTETKMVKLEKIDQLVQKAMETASAVPERDPDYVFTMIKEGKTYYLNVDDSRESMALVRMISDLCR